MNKKEKKYNLKSLVLLLLLTAVLLIVATYAWFTSNQTVTVSGLNVNVEAKDGLQISVDGTNWKSIIQSTDILSAHTTYSSSVNQLPEYIEPVSTIGNIDTATGFMEMFYGAVVVDDDPTDGTGEYLLTAARSTETRTAGAADTTDQKFIAYDLFFKVATNTDIYLGTNSLIIPKPSSTSKGIEYATRIGLVVEGNTDVSDTVANIQSMIGGTNATRYIWEPNFNAHTAAGVANARDTYGRTVTTVPTDAVNSSALVYEGVKAGIVKDDSVFLRQLATGTYTAFLDSVTPQYKTVKDFDKNLQIFSLTAGITKVRVYMWIEGQDVDCENNASNSDIQFNLEITTVEPTP